MFIRMATFVLVALLALTAGEGLSPTAAKKKPKKYATVTRTFSNTAPIDLPGPGNAVPYPSPLHVGGFKTGTITDVNLVLHDLTHDFPDEIDMLLVAPDGRNALVLSDVGGASDVSALTLTLDDEAPAPMPIGSQLSAGAFRPTNGKEIEAQLPAPAPASSGNVVLSVFDGMDPNGQWRLFVLNEPGTASGGFDGGWSLRITAKVTAKNKMK